MKSWAPSRAHQFIFIGLSLVAILAASSFYVLNSRPSANTTLSCTTPSPSPSPRVTPPPSPRVSPTPRVSPSPSASFVYSSPKPSPRFSPPLTSSPTPSAATYVSSRPYAPQLIQLNSVICTSPSASPRVSPTPSIKPSSSPSIRPSASPSVKPSPSPSPSPQNVGIKVKATITSWEWALPGGPVAGNPGRREQNLKETAKGLSGAATKLFRESDGVQICSTQETGTNGETLFTKAGCTDLEPDVAYTVQIGLSTDQKVYYFESDNGSGVLQAKSVYAIASPYDPPVVFPGYRPIVAGEMFEKDPTNFSSPLLNPAYRLCIQHTPVVPSPRCVERPIKGELEAAEYYIQYLDSSRLRENNFVIGLDNGNNELRDIVRWRANRQDSWKTNPAWNNITINPKAPNQYDLFVKDSEWEEIKLNVPGVREGRGGQCGVASVIMATLYENPSYNNRKWLLQKKSPWPDGRVAPNDTKEPDQTYLQPWPITNRSQGTGCVSTKFLNDNTPSGNWVRIPDGTGTHMMVINSIRRKHPVIIYTYGLFFGRNQEHIALIRGFKWRKGDLSTLTIYINNPNIGSVDVHYKTTWSQLKPTLGKGPYSTDFLLNQ